MPPSRRTFLATASLAGASLLLPKHQIFAQTPPAPAPQSNGARIKLGIATYSYWHFTTNRVSITDVIEKTAALGLEGVDVLHRQMPNGKDEDNAYLQDIKRNAFLNGIDLICLSMHQNFVSKDPEYRQRNINHTLKCIEIAYKLGIPCMRINAGQWNTRKNFDDLMAHRGHEVIPEGLTEDDGFKWAIDCIEKCLPKAAECGVLLALENHWGLSGTPEGMLRIHKAINSPWLQLLVDTGNFLEDPYDKIEKVLPHACYVQAKTYFGGGEWYTLDLDYKRIINMMKARNYHGYLGIEFEGKAPADEGVRKSIEMLRAAMA
ncbi:MAG: sugar phosphate isomerase/epimerase [Puniceicoccales bacterium]|nr:sugar phosphate isomerase/epimerase [Puniceicoccales bacterium]